MAPIRPIRGLFGRFEGIQSWGPGTHPSLREFGRSWLERHFPELHGGGRQPGRLGAVWIREIDGRWFVVHVCIPEWSSDRLIPAWSVAVLSPADMAREPCLEAAFEDVRSAVRNHHSWASSTAAYPAVTWTPGAMASAGAIFDASMAPPDERIPGVRLPAAFFDSEGWVGLQAMLVAMSESGLVQPCCVRVLEQAWTAAAPDLIPPHALVVADGPGAGPLPRRVDVRELRGVGLAQFIPDFAAARSVMLAIVRAAAGASGVVPFAQLAAGFVPLELIDASWIEHAEIRAWAMTVARSARDRDALGARIDQLATRIGAGQAELLPHMLALASEWADANGPAATDTLPRVEAWLARAVRVA